MKPTKKSKRLLKNYPKGGDGMFFYHKKTRHPALQVSHTKNTWINRRITHHPNRPNDYYEDKELSVNDVKVYCKKKLNEDSIYTRGRPLKIKKSV